MTPHPAPSWRTAIAADAWRQQGRFDWLTPVNGILPRCKLPICTTLRICQALALPLGITPILLTPLGRALHKLATSMGVVDSARSARVDVGLGLIRGRGIAVAPGARIGRNLTLFCGVTAGRRDRIDAARRRAVGYLVIEDAVWVGPRAVTAGAVTAGCGRRIGAGAFVTARVPPNSVVVGNPGRVVRIGAPADVMNPAP